MKQNFVYRMLFADILLIEFFLSFYVFFLLCSFFSFILCCVRLSHFIKEPAAVVVRSNGPISCTGNRIDSNR